MISSDKETEKSIERERERIQKRHFLLVKLVVSFVVSSDLRLLLFLHGDLRRAMQCVPAVSFLRQQQQQKQQNATTEVTNPFPFLNLQMRTNQIKHINISFH